MKVFNPLLIVLFFIACNSVNKKGSTANEYVNPPEKDSMILLTDRPANLETPLKYFLLDYTPNKVFFVRWHLSGVPSSVNTDTFRLRINGNVNKEIALSLEDLKTKFQAVEVTAVAQCAGNSRSFFDPRVTGGQWKNGAMGNAKWKGVKVKDILEMAGVKKGSLQVAFNGLDKPPMDSVPDFIKALDLEHAMDGEVMVAYEMNNEPLPVLNGFPLKLIVPGWYATYWVGMLSDITVYADSFPGFWMKKAYLVPKNVENGNESPEKLSKDMEPINRMDVRSIFVNPEPESIIATGKPVEIQGLAMDDGKGISKVEISVDSGVTWNTAKLDASLGNYSWRRWRYAFKPTVAGKYNLQVKATNTEGKTQPVHQWNRSGYMRNEIETLTLNAE